ncbi:MAG: hypothetical protein MUE42_12155 [Opitutaceae bacterium]|nr:hypothetical protein [Opitutaceae bacterium]
MKDFPSETPRLETWPFLVADGVLVGTAALIGWQAEAPLGVAPLAGISVLVGLGAIAGLYPFVMNHARRQEEALQERASQIEALARTVGASAEQISIAVANLPVIAENAARQLKIAEQLPADLQARLANLQQQLSATASEENAGLRHELDTLRAAETGKLAAALDGLAHATADLTRLENLAAKHSAALDAALTHLPRVADSFGQQASEILRRETASAAAALHDAADQAGRSIEGAAQAAREALVQSVQEAITRFGEQAKSLAAQALVAPAPEPAPAPQAVVSAPAPEPVVAVAAPEPEPEPVPEAEPEVAPVAVEPVVVEAAPEVVAEEETAEAEEAESEVEEAATDVQQEEEAEEEEETEPAEEDAEEEAEEEADDEAQAEAPVAEATQESAQPEAAMESALSHDGFTRLVVTAYIGIGNKLYIRGDGPGLRTDKGVPLQFVSIGKWRWESAELLFPARVRLYKNDTVECTKLGEIELEPGHHHEVTATF